MSIYRECRTQAELDAAIRDGKIPDLRGDGEFVVRGSATVHAGDSATVHAWGSATVRAWGSATVHAGRSATVHAGRFVPVQVHERDTDAVSVTGGVLIIIRPARTVEEWADLHGVEVVGGHVTLYKVVRDDWRSAHGTAYVPGTTVTAPDWDGGDRECGGGLHFCAVPFLCDQYDGEGTRYVACRVAVADCRTPREWDSMPDKIKAWGCEVIGQVDADGRPVEGPEVTR